MTKQYGDNKKESRVADKQVRIPRTQKQIHITDSHSINVDLILNPSRFLQVLPDFTDKANI